MAVIDQTTTTDRRPTLSGEEEATSSVEPKAAAPGALVSRKKPEIASTHRQEAGVDGMAQTEGLAAAHHQPLPECCGKPTGGGRPQRRPSQPHRPVRQGTADGRRAVADVAHPTRACSALHRGGWIRPPFFTQATRKGPRRHHAPRNFAPAALPAAAAAEGGVRERKIRALLLKLDIEKAFDSVSWDFLLEVLEARGFGQNWRNWISAILATASTRILINGELSDKIWHRRGLRQGDPLSPLLFVLVMDVLPALLLAADIKGALKPIGSQLPRFRASLYADDVIMFINPCHDEVAATRRILDAFGEASGLRTNFAKSTISPIRCQDTPLQPLVLESNCQIAELPCTYLGLPLSVKRLTRAQLQPAIDKILNKMASWNTISSAAGRLTLLLSVVYAMPIFQILAVHPPAWFIKRIDKAARGFLWANKESAPGAKCLVGWKQICKPKMYGGLGIPDLAARSIALRCRWLWQTWMCPNKPWVGLSFPIDNKVRAIFDASVNIHIGDGEKTQFWTDGWRQEGKLCTLFPDLYLHCTLRHISIKRALENDKWIRHFKAPLPSATV
ncbi:hypothetical protein QYE76_029922 [Lolium multiflorum]|uniref:Reverse transcriptase domain-containing protein n=1 Tax=Lolium multiflorum TaxID=4521 RepID=A0AAD8QQM9_LOLMU|nr:hypothetical protein QYE76_029922 [Lolium multiflorum]